MKYTTGKKYKKNRLDVLTENKLESMRRENFNSASGVQLQSDLATSSI